MERFFGRLVRSLVFILTVLPPVLLLPLTQENAVDLYSVDRGENIYRVIQNDCRGFNNLSYTIHLR